MNKDKSGLEDIVSELVEGKSIDWDISKNNYPEDLGLLNQFEAIDKITQAFGTLINDNSVDTVDSKEIIFEWGHLQILEKIGEGSYGEVYSAYDPVLDRNVALKLLKKEKSSGFQSRAFMQEAKRLAKVRNRHVLAVHGASIHDLRVGMWSDLINGVNLSEGNNQAKNYSRKELIYLISSLADALKAVHGAGLVHGDIKPSNVMQDKQGKLILMDFGAGIENSNEYTQSGYVVATPMLMSPELFNDDTISPASDIYALGVLLFKLATGKYPIEAKNISSVADIQQAHENKAYLTLQKLRPDLPKSLNKLMQQMMSYDSVARPTAKDIKNKIDWIIATPKRRNKQISLSIIFALLIMAIMISTTAYYRVKQEKQKADTVSDFMLNMINSTANFGKGRDVRVVEILDYAANNVNKRFAKQPFSRAAIHNLLGNSYINLQLPEEALNHLTQALALKKKILSKDDPELIYTLYLIAYTHQKLANFSESKKLYQEIILLAEKDKETNIHLIQLVNIRLAQILTRHGHLLEAEKQLINITKNLSKKIDTHGDNEYLSLFALAGNYLSQSKYEKAEQAAIKSLEWLNKYPNNSQDNRNSLNGLIASSLVKQGRLDEAEILYRQALVEAERLYGQNNKGYLIMLVNLGAVLQEHGKLHEAMELQILSLEISKNIQGSKVLYTIIIGINLANTKVSLGDLKGGEKLMRDTLSDAYDQLGNDHIETLKLEYNLAELLNNTRRFIEAEKLAKSNNLKMLKRLGKTHLFTLLSADNIAVSLTGQKKYKLAIDLYQQILSSIEKTVGLKSPYYFLVLSHYVDSLKQSNNINKAKELLQAHIKLQIETLGENHKNTLESKDLLGTLSN